MPRLGKTFSRIGILVVLVQPVFAELRVGLVSQWQDALALHMRRNLDVRKVEHGRRNVDVEDHLISHDASRYSLRIAQHHRNPELRGSCMKRLS